MLAGVQAIPGLGGTGFASMLPLNRPDPNVFNAVAHEEFLAGRTDGTPSARTLISPGYLRAMGIALRAGRDFDERDTRTTPRVAIVSENLARQLWPGRDPIGRSLATRSNHPATNERLEWLEVVGVVDDIDPILRERSQNPYVYLSLGQEWQPAAMNLVARVQGDQAASVQRLKQAVLGADPLADVYQVQTLGQMVATILYPRRLAGAILTASGLIGMLLASLGLYGVVSYSVAQRVQEIGIRATLGADARDIVRLIVSEGVRVVAAGTALGFGLSYSALRITSRFVTVPAIDPITLIATPAVLTAVVLLACYLPARRAARADPMVALRQL
jgi:putative ABC transport system permease protein